MTSGRAAGIAACATVAVTGLAPAARFPAPGPAPQPPQVPPRSGAPGALAALGPIQVVHKDAASIEGYTAAAGAGTLCCLTALGLALTRRP